jgi:antitoxin MazE
MPSTLKLVPIGNSKGIRLPSGLIRRYHLTETIRLTEMPNGILLENHSPKKLSLAASFEAMAKDKEAMDDAKTHAESGLQDGLESEDFKGWPR